MLRAKIVGGTRLRGKIEGQTRLYSDGDLLYKIGTLIERQAKLNASGRPGPMVRTNRLRASITTRLSPKKDQVVVGTNVFYAPFVEFGHRQTPGRFVPVLGKRLVASFAPTYPFMQPAVLQIESTGQTKGVLVDFSRKIQLDWLK